MPVLLSTHHLHLLKYSIVGGGKDLECMYHGTKLRGRNGHKGLQCRRCSWWSNQSGRRGSSSGLKHEHYSRCCRGRWYNLCGWLILLCLLILWYHRCCYMWGISCQLGPLVESELLSTMSAMLKMNLCRIAHML